MGCFCTLGFCDNEHLSSPLFLKQQELVGFPGKAAKHCPAPQPLLHVEPSEEKHLLPGQRWASQGTASVPPKLQPRDGSFPARHVLVKHGEYLHVLIRG